MFKPNSRADDVLYLLFNSNLHGYSIISLTNYERDAMKLGFIQYDLDPQEDWYVLRLTDLGKRILP